MQRNDLTTSSDKIPAAGHRLELDLGRGITMTGVSAVPVFTDKEISLRLKCGETLNITGQGLTVKNLDIENGKLSAEGRVFSVKYSAAPSGFLKKLFR